MQIWPRFVALGPDSGYGLATTKTPYRAMRSMSEPVATANVKQHADSTKPPTELPKNLY